MGERVKAVVEGSGLRLDRWLAERHPVFSRTTCQAWIREGRVTVEGRLQTKPGFTLEAGMHVEYDVPEAPPAVALEPILDGRAEAWVVYQDDALLVINKPRGIVVHPARGHHGDTLVEALLDKLEPGAEAAALYRPGVVHRLDRDTTGLMLLARRPEVRFALSRMIQERRVLREYLALSWGVPDPLEGVVDAPIGRDPGNRLRMAAVHQGKPARTHYRTSARWECERPVSLLALRLETGRTHQIRVHLGAIGHPVVGDPLYGRAPELGFNAQALHAVRLEFQHPTTGQRLAFEAPLPADWTTGLRTLGAPTWQDGGPEAALWMTAYEEVQR